jgi:CubicO group peptidase (beta-lactamase class C family)
LHSRASYSNIAFTLLGYAVQNFTGKPYIQALKDAVTVPLGMARTGFTPGPLDSAVIPPVKNQVWGVDFDEINP